MEILYVVNSKVENAQTVNDVPDDASFVWYDFQ